MFYHVCAASLAEGIEKSMKALHENGILETRENQDRENVMKEIQLVLDVTEPMSEPFVSKAMPCDIKVLVQYEDEFINGSADNAGWKYTYHGLYTPFYDKALGELRRNSKTRRSCIALGQGDITFTSDPPCLQLIMFNVVGGKLDITVVFRSNDGVKAFPMNIHAVRALQIKAAAELGYETGCLHYVANNFHAYENDILLLESYCALFDKYTTPETLKRKTYSREQYEKAKEAYFDGNKKI
jgi:thymidylate synthase